MILLSIFLVAFSIVDWLSLGIGWFVDLHLSLLSDLKIEMRNTIMNDSWLDLLRLLLLFVVYESSVISFLVGLFESWSTYRWLLILSSGLLLLEF